MKLLIRDNVDYLQKMKNKKVLSEPIVTKASEEEYPELLEELIENNINLMMENPSLETMADVMEVLDTFRQFNKLDGTQLNFTKERKLNIEGGYQSRTCIDISN